MELLKIEDVSLKKGNAQILNKVNLSLGMGEVHAVIGPNGAGKSSLSYVLMGLEGYNDHEGRIYLEGKDITGYSVTERAKAGLTMGWQEPARFEGISVEQYLGISLKNAQDYSRNGRKILQHTVSEALEKVALSPQKYLKRSVDKSLSGGERKRVELASILLMRPRVVILDEPDSGIDTLAIEKIFEIIEEFKQLGIGILLITHSNKILSIADRASLLCSGHIIKTGSPSEAADYYTDQCLSCIDERYPREVAE